MRNKYHNYNPHPVKKIGGHDSEIWENYDSAAEDLRKEAEKRKKQGRVLVVFDLYPGVRKEEVLNWPLPWEPTIFWIWKPAGNQKKNG